MGGTWGTAPVNGQPEPRKVQGQDSAGGGKMVVFGGTTLGAKGEELGDLATFTADPDGVSGSWKIIDGIKGYVPLRPRHAKDFGSSAEGSPQQGRKSRIRGVCKIRGFPADGISRPC